MAPRKNSFVVVGSDTLPHFYSDWLGAKAKLGELDLKAVLIVNGAPVKVERDIVMILPPKPPRKPRETKEQKAVRERAEKTNEKKK